MKKFTSKDLLDALGLQVGDKIIFCNDIFELKEIDGLFIFCNINNKNEGFWIVHLIDQDFDILPKPKRVGDLKCGELDSCRACPLQWPCFREVDEKMDMETLLYEQLESFVITDQEIYNLLKNRLDKEVE